MIRLVSVLPSVGRPRVPVSVLAAVIALAVVAGGGWLWFRDSGLVRVDHVYVVGVSSSEGPQVRSALTAAAEGMTTLHVREQDLRDAVRSFSSVASLRVQADFPHDLTVEVVERTPVALVEIGGRPVPVGAGGRLMPGVRAARALPTIRAARLAPGDRISDRRALGAIDVLARAPAELRSRVARAFSGPKGLTLDLRDGPQLYFGSATDSDRKWLAAARVLADSSAAGAVYLDVRVPARVAAGGLGTVSADPTDPLALNPHGQQTNPQPQPENTATLNP